MLRYSRGPETDPFYELYRSPGWLSDYDPPRPFPFWLNVELTNRCQLDCVFCSRRLSTRPLGEIDLALVEKLAAEAAEHPGAGVRLTGWGEPLLHRRAGEAVSIIKKAGLPLKIYTNGLALTPELMSLFIKLGVDDLQFSMQGLTPAQYEFNRRKSSYAALRVNIEMASSLRGDRPKPFLSVLTSVLADEAKEADPAGFCDDLLTLTDKVAVDLTNLNFVAETPEAGAILDRQSHDLARRKCVDVFLALEVKYDGAIQFCGQDADARPEHTIGNLNDMSLAEAWLSPKMEAQRERVGRNLGHDSMSVCRHCYHNTSKYEVFKSVK